MPFVKVYIHFVWSTKNRFPFLDTPELREKIWKHMKVNAKSKSIFIDTINGYHEHCHCLVSLGVDQSMSKIMQLIKGESSFWINKHSLCKQKFEWQEEYYAASVSESAIENVRHYIRNQEEHHRKKTYQEEYDEFLEEYGLQQFKDGDGPDSLGSLMGVLVFFSPRAEAHRNSEWICEYILALSFSSVAKN